jgi:DNA polymerase III subunit beta
MNFLVNSTALLRQLQTLSGVMNTSNSLPILDYFLFEIEPGSLTVSASDLGTTMVIKIDVEASESGSIAVPGRILLDALKMLPDQPLNFTYDPKTFGIEVSSEFGKYKLTGLNADEFPKAPEVENFSEVTMSGDVLTSAISQALFAAGNDEMRPVMSGIFFEFHEDHINFVSTDAHRLVKYSRTDATSENPASLILPKKPLNLLKTTLGDEDLVRLRFNEKHALFTFDSVSLSCRLIEGKYPNYEAVIPKVNPKVLTIDRLDFLTSIKRVAVFASKSTHQIRIKISGSELTISAEDLDFANEAVERLTCNYVGDDIEIGFNARFLTDMLSNLNSETILLEMSEPNRAGLLSPGETSNENEKILMVVMPVMLNS